MSKIILVNPPVVGVSRPSMALGILHTKLQNAGFYVKTVNAHIRFAEYVGLESYRFLVNNYNSLVSEWLFSRLLFPGATEFNEKSLIGVCHALGDSGVDIRKLAALRDLAEQFIVELASEIAAEAPDLIGITSVFQQHTASLSLALVLKSSIPDTLIMMGGSNLEGVMGKTTLSICPHVDMIVSGEADDVIVPLCNALLGPDRISPAEAARSFNILAQSADVTEEAPRLIVDDLRAPVPPNYDDYFRELKSSPLGEFIHPALLIEGSRGCWWGQISHCTFCGLNGSSMSFRAKDATVIQSEIEISVLKYECCRIGMVDNIFANEWFDTLLPVLAEQPDKKEIFFETKTNLKRQNIADFKRAGVISIQPGIETFSSDILKLMGKGSTGVHAVQLLKWCQEYGVDVRWGMLWGFPGEQDQSYDAMSQWLPWIKHLQPPLGFNRVEYHRFSPYFDKAARWNLDLAPANAYKHVYPFDSEVMHNLAYRFEDLNAVDGPSKSVQLVEECIESWRRSYSHQFQQLRWLISDSGSTVVDERGRMGDGVLHFYFDVSETSALEIIDTAPPARQIHSLLSNTLGDINRVDSFLCRLFESRLALELDGRFVWLPVRLSEGYSHDGQYAPYGRVDWQAWHRSRSGTEAP